jgi:hypothetical protein
LTSRLLSRLLRSKRTLALFGKFHETLKQKQSQQKTCEVPHGKFPECARKSF